MIFNKVISEKINKKVLIDGVDKKTIPHAQLFFGPNGSGKLNTALAYIQYILCENKKKQDSCGECSNCQKNQLLIHPDVHFIFPVTSGLKIKKPISSDYLDVWKEMILNSTKIDLESWRKTISKSNKKLSIYVHEAWSIEKIISLKSYQGDYKIFLIWHAEKLNTAASNKLLKSLEEPPPQTIFILISEKKDLLIKTILSRVISLKFNLKEDDSLLVNSKKNDKNEKFLNWFADWMRLCFQAKKMNRIDELIMFTEGIANLNRSEQIDFLNFTTEHFRKTFLYNYNLNNALSLSIEHENFSIEKFSLFVHSKNIIPIFEKIEETIYYISRNASSKLLFLDLSMDLAQLIYKDPDLKLISSEL